MPFEFGSSVIVTTFLLAFSRCKFAAKLLVVGAVIIFGCLWGRRELVCFLSGSMLCDIDLYSQHERPRTGKLKTFSEVDEEKLPQWESAGAATPGATLVEVSEQDDIKQWLALSVIGLYLLSTSDLDIGDTPGQRALYQLIPSTYTDEKRYLQSLGATSTPWFVGILHRFNKHSIQNLRSVQGGSAYLGVLSVVHVVGYLVTPNI